MRTVVVGRFVLLSLLSARIALSQPATDQPGSDTRPSSATTTIPITLSGETEVMDAERTAGSPTAAAIALEQPLDPDTYVCGAGDSFELVFWGQQNFRLKVAANLEGRLFISKVGFVEVAHKTLTVVRSEVTKKVRANYPGLRFELSLLAPRSFIVHVAENVQKPGSYSASPLA